MVNCIYCRTEMQWQSDYNYNDIHIDGDGKISMFICPSCGAIAEFSRKNNE